MKIIRPETVTDSIFQSSDVPEDDYSAWLVGTTYADEDRVIVTTPNIHKIYESQQAANTGNDPTTDDGTWWVEVSSTNRWKMFNGIVQEQTVQAGGMEVVLQSPTVINSLSLINVDCASVTVEMVDATEGTVYDETFSLISDSGIQDWYAYFFEPIVREDRLAILDLPPYANAEITVTFTDDVTAKCGALIIGQFADLGFSQHGASYSIIDYSVKSTDSQGRVTITDGPYANKLEVDVILDTEVFGVVRNVLTDLRTTPVVWVPEETNKSSIVYGYYREFDIILSNPTTSRCSLEIEGLV
jgi:hypothetical protein